MNPSFLETTSSSERVPRIHQFPLSLPAAIFILFTLGRRGLGACRKKDALNINKKVQRLSLKNGLTLGSYDKKQSVVVWIYCRISWCLD